MRGRASARAIGAVSERRSRSARCVDCGACRAPEARTEEPCLTHERVSGHFARATTLGWSAYLDTRQRLHGGFVAPQVAPAQAAARPGTLSLPRCKGPVPHPDARALTGRAYAGSC